MKTDSIYTINNKQTGKLVKSGMTFQEVKRLVFNKMSRNNFNDVCLVDYQVVDEANGDYLPLQHIHY